EPAHGADQIALVAAERLLDDRPPVVLAAGPAVDGRHEPRVHRQGYPEVVRPLGLVDRVRQALELVELAPEPGPLFEEVPGDRTSAGRPRGTGGTRSTRARPRAPAPAHVPGARGRTAARARRRDGAVRGRRVRGRAARRRAAWPRRSA